MLNDVAGAGCRQWDGVRGELGWEYVNFSSVPVITGYSSEQNRLHNLLPRRATEGACTEDL